MLIRQFAVKAIVQYEAGLSRQTIVLTNCCTDTSWFQILVECTRRNYGAVMFTYKRLSFLYPCDELQAEQNRAAQTIFYWGKRKEFVKKTLAEIAYTMP